METTVKTVFNAHINNHTVVNIFKFGPEMYYFYTGNYNKSPVNVS